jgi:hypothetical protein
MLFCPEGKYSEETQLHPDFFRRPSLIFDLSFGADSIVLDSQPEVELEHEVDAVRLHQSLFSLSNFGIWAIYLCAYGFSNRICKYIPASFVLRG